MAHDENHRALGLRRNRPAAQQHKVLLSGDGKPAFCRTTYALQLSFAEFVVAARDYPIVFASGGSAAGEGYVPVIVLGSPTVSTCL